MNVNEKNAIIAKSAMMLCRNLFEICHSESVKWNSDNEEGFHDALWAVTQIVNGEKEFQNFIQGIKEEES